jgi:predicted small integral membrane protein
MIKSRTMRWEGHVAWMGRGRDVYGVFRGKPEGKRQLGSYRCRWEDNIEMDLQEVVYVGMDWIGLAQDKHSWRALVSTVKNLRVP